MKDVDGDDGGWGLKMKKDTSSREREAIYTRAIGLASIANRHDNHVSLSVYREIIG